VSNITTGGCLCGNISFEFDRETVISTHSCHCKDCQKMTGSGKATIVAVPTEALALNGEVKTFTVTGTDGMLVTRGFCPNCGSQLISYLEVNPTMRYVKAGAIDDSSWVTVDSSFWSSTAEPWSPVDTSRPVFEKNPAALG
jgi:hypothetical protein